MQHHAAVQYLVSNLRLLVCCHRFAIVDVLKLRMRAVCWVLLAACNAVAVGHHVPVALLSVSCSAMLQLKMLALNPASIATAPACGGAHVLLTHTDGVVPPGATNRMLFAVRAECICSAICTTTHFC